MNVLALMLAAGTLCNPMPIPDTPVGDLAEFANPFVGTDGPGHAYPAAARPFGMVQAGPDTGTGAWDYCSGYQYRDKAVLGYSQTHLNGTGCPDLGDVQILPFSGACGAMPMKRAIDKASEKASPGWYEVRQPDDGVKVEIAAAKRAAIYRFTWERGRDAKVLVNLPFGIDVSWAKLRVTGSDVELAENRIVRGEIRKDAWIGDRKVAFELEFDREWAKVEELPREKEKDAPRYVMSFDLPASQTVMMKVALSLSSAEHAKANLAADIPDWDIGGVRDAARTEWNALFARSVCEGTEEQKRNWYTALYHLYLQPNDCADAGCKPYCTTLSLWDTFRAAHPWYSTVTPEIVTPVIDSMMELWRQNGRLPVMSYGGKNVDCMIGNHSVPVIVDAFLKSGEAASPPLRNKGHSSSTSGEDAASPLKKWESVYAAIKNTLTQAHAGKPKEDWRLYDKYGYFPCDLIRGESVSRTFECAYDDWCAAQMAKRLGKADDYEFFMKRAGYWRNVLDLSIGFARGKTSDGKWREPFDPFAFGHGAGRDNDFTEGNAFQYTWHVMHDVDGLVAAMGGREAALDRLRGLFTADATSAGAPQDVSGLIGQYVHGNEPSHHVIYLFSLLGRPDLAARYVREVFDRFYLPKPEGLCGNDDCGQMSAWYLFSAMGFYPLNPCGGEYVIGAPQVPMAQVEVGGRGRERLFTVIARGLSRENKYVKSVTLNGRPITDWRIRHEDIVKGGELVFEMAAEEPFADAHWIGFPGRFFHWNTRAKVRPAPVFRRVFVLGEVPDDARLAVSAAGYRDVTVNGRPLSDDLLMPTPSNYDRRTYYSTYPVAALLRPGTNVLEVTLGNSIYNCSAQGPWMQDTITWRDSPQLLLRVFDGRGRTLVATDETWETTEDGPVRADSIRNGETFDARVRTADAVWRRAVRSHGPGGVLTEERHPPVRIFGRLPMRRCGADTWDAGENLAGFAEIRVRGTRGATVKLRYREELGPDGRVAEQGTFVESGEFQTDCYTLSGEGTETWRPRFVYHGFRYLETVASGAVEVVSADACKVGTDVKEVGDFTSSHAALNDIHARMRRSLRANLVGFPTDCPTREKQGWTGDALYGCEAMLYGFDAASTYADWLRTLVDVQRPNGQIPVKSPLSANGYNWGCGPAWDAALVLIPEKIYDFTGDDSPVREFYPAMRRMLAYADGMLVGDLAENYGLGDWLPPGRTAPATLVSTAYMARMHRTMARFAGLLGRADDRTHHLAREARIAGRFRETWCRAEGHVAGDEPVSLALAAYWELAPDPRATAALLDRVMRERDYKADFGMLGSAFVPRALGEYGFAETALRIFAQPEYPGWEWQRRKGATTIWEDFKGANSHNHVIFGDPSAWAFRYLGGIRFKDGKAVKTEPIRPASVDFFKATCRGITVEWHR